MEPLLSVIVPIYKTEQFLRQCVDSILNQTYQALEVILVDDGSPDGCGAICDEYALRDRRVRVIHQPNCGQAVARNVGLDCAKGEYITFVDSDDRIHESLYQTVMEGSPFELKIFGCTTVDLDSGASAVLAPTTRKATLTWKTDGKEIGELFQSSLFGYACNKIYHKSTIENIRFQDIKLREDLLFNIEAGQRTSQIAVSSCAGYIYQIHANSTLHGLYHGPVPDIAETAIRFNSINPNMKDTLDEAIANWLIKTYITDALHKYVFLNTALTDGQRVDAVKDVIKDRRIGKFLRFYPGEGALFFLITLSYKIHCPALLYHVLKRIWKS